MLSLSMLSAVAQDKGQDSDNVQKDVSQTIKEVFVKGSIDGKSLFLVYGMGDAINDSKELFEDAIELEDLKDIGVDAKEDLQTMGQRIYSKNDDSHLDYADIIHDAPEVYKDSMNEAGKHAEQIIAAPWKSLKKIPESHKLTMEQAQDAYHSSDSKIGGALKYSGLAVWAKVKGSYYLIIEAPVESAAQILATTGCAAWSVLYAPGHIAIHTVGLVAGEAAQLVGTAFKITWQGIKFTGATVGSAVMTSYGLVSSSVATAVTLAAAGGLLAYQGGRWITVELPSRFFRPVTVKQATEVNYTDHKEFAKTIKANLENSNIGGFQVNVRSDIDKYKGKFVISLNQDDITVKAFILKTRIKDKQVELKIVATPKLKRAISRSQNISKRAAKEVIEEMVQDLLASI